MRIVSGMLRGRRLIAPQGTSTRPTTDRVREALFSTLVSLTGVDLGGGPVLDAFAGSGALGFEALSRGAGPVTFVERDREALTALRHNAASLGVAAQCQIVRGDTFSLAKRGVLRGPFSLLLLDPPYTLDAAVVVGILETMAHTGALSAGSWSVWEHAAETTVEWPVGFGVVAAKRYGTTAVEIATYEGGTGDQ